MKAQPQRANQKAFPKVLIIYFCMEQKAWVSQTANWWLFTDSQNLPLCAFAKFHLCKTYFAKLSEERIPARRSHLILRILGNHEVLKQHQDWCISSDFSQDYAKNAKRRKHNFTIGVKVQEQIVAATARGKTTLPAVPLSGSDPLPPGYPFTAQTLFPLPGSHTLPQQHPLRDSCVPRPSTAESYRRNSPRRDSNLPLKHKGQLVPLRAAIS